MKLNKITEIIELLDEKISDLKDGFPIGLADGKMGHCIYFYYISSISGNKFYMQNAERLIGEVFKQISMINTFDIKHGLMGIGLGVNYLIENEFIKGNSNDILEDVDNLLFKQICNLDKINNDDLSFQLQLIYYFTIRLKKQIKNSENEYLFKEAIIKTINFISDKIYRNFSDEPVLFSMDNPSIQTLLVLSLCCDIHREKMYRILNEISLNVLSKIPILHANRLYLLYAMDSINKKIEMKGWNEHIKLLVCKSDIEYIIENELADYIYFSNGLPAIYFLLLNLGGYFSSNQIYKYNRMIVDKIEKSPIWNKLLNDENYLKHKNGLFSGYTGISILLHKHYENENRFN